MGSTKRIIVFTQVIVALIIIVENSNANGKFDLYI